MPGALNHYDFNQWELTKDIGTKHSAQIAIPVL